MNRLISITLKADLAYTSLVSSLAGQVAELFATRSGTTGNIAEFCHAFELSASESFTNSVRYADPVDVEPFVGVEFSADGDSLTVTMTDTNAEFEPHPPVPDIAGYPEMGYGLFVIARMMDTVTYARVDGRNLLSMTKQVFRPASGIEYPNTIQDPA